MHAHKQTLLLSQHTEEERETMTSLSVTQNQDTDLDWIKVWLGH